MLDPEERRSPLQAGIFSVRDSPAASRRCHPDRLLVRSSRTNSVQVPYPAVVPDSTAEVLHRTDEDVPISPDVAPSRGRLRSWGGPLAVVAAVIVGNLLPLLGTVDVSPLVFFGHTGVVTRGGFLPGWQFTDAYAGYTSQALGHLAATDWLHGTIPWWNPFEALGAPLLAEMQSAAFFLPFNLLLALPQGPLYLNMLLEVGAGLATWFLLREIGFTRAVATFGGMLFALNGTFAWLSELVTLNPIPFLPVMLLGLERLYRRRNLDVLGLVLVAGGLAESIYGGFPETTYLEVLFVVVWFVFRVAARPAAGRRAFLARSALGGVTGLALAAPLIVPFLGYLSYGYLGPNVSGFASTHLAAPSAATVGLPYLLGPIKAFEGNFAVATSWVQVGGFVTAGSIAIAFVGLAGRGRERGLRWLLACTVVLLLLWSFGAPVVQPVFEHVLPAVKDVEFFRYSPPVWELAFTLLVCFGLEKVASRGDRCKALVLAGGAFALCAVGLVLLVERSTLAAERALPHFDSWPVITVAWAGGVVVTVTVVGVVGGWLRVGAHGRGRYKIASYVMGAILVLDGLAAFLLPELSAPRSVDFDSGPARYLASHLGMSRFFSLGVYLPDYGSYFRLASLDVTDVPIPKAWITYLDTKLVPGAPDSLFGIGLTPYYEELIHALLTNFSAYEAVDVRYVLVPDTLQPFGPGPRFSEGVRAVYHDSEMTIYQLPDPKPYFSSLGSSCTLRPLSRTEVVASCAGAASLERSEIDTPGWSVSINGHSAVLRSVGGLQTVSLPAGTSRVSFAYLPPHETPALAACFAAFAGLCALAVASWVRGRPWEARFTSVMSGPRPRPFARIALPIRQQANRRPPTGR